MTYVKNAILGVLAIALIAGAGVPSVQAQSTADMQAQIAALLAQVQALTAQLNAGTSASITFTRNLTVGSSGADVLALQKFLNANGCPVSLSGAGSVGMESSYFGAKTKAAVACWQAAKGISPAVGYFGPVTRAAVNAMVVVTPTTPTTPTTPGTPGLSGGAGSVESYTLVSSLSNEEVGEGANDVRVAGLEIEADNGSDLLFTALRLVFDEGTGATGDFDEYADEVSIWLGNTEVARLDADEFTDDNDWSQTISLNSNAVIRAGADGTFYVAISGANNLDSGDIGDIWDVDFTSARFRDAQGATISEDPTVGITSFSFETFAASADTEFKISAGLDSVNDAHVINIATSGDDTDNVDILSFNVEIEGTSDVYLDALVVTVSTSAANLYDFLSGLSLWMDGDEVGSANLGTDCLESGVCTTASSSRSYVFDDLDLDLDGGSDYDFLVKADIKSTSDAGVADGDTIHAWIGETETNNAAFDAEDESGEELANADITGSATSEASEVRDIGMMVALVNTAAAKTFTGDTAVSSSHDQGTFSITFDVTAFDGDIWLDKTAPTSTAGVTAHDLDFTGTATLLASSIVTNSGAHEGTDAFRIDEGDTERFTVTAVVAAGADGLFDMSISEFIYALTDANGGIEYTFNLDEFETTPQIFLNFDEV